MKKVIGGEFELLMPSSPKKHENDARKGNLYSSGRGALYYIWKSVQQNHPHVKRILIPDYICDSVVETLNYAKAPWMLYHLSEGLTINQNSFTGEELANSAIIIVNYYGLVPIKQQISYIRSLSPQTIIIEDDVQSFYTMFLESDADYRFTSFRKTLPLPDGGWVLSKHHLLSAEKGENTFAQYKIAGSILKSQRSSGYYADSLYLRLFEQGEELINDNITKSISRFSSESYVQIDYNRYGILRKRNAEYLVKELEGIDIKPILPIEDNIPLFVPLRLVNRNNIRRALFADNIFCPIHWPFTDVFTDDFVLGKVMAREELSIIVDYRYTISDMKRIVNIIKKNI